MDQAKPLYILSITLKFIKVHKNTHINLTTIKAKSV